MIERVIELIHDNMGEITDVRNEIDAIAQLCL